MFSPTHLVFLKLDTYLLHLDFKILDKKNNEVIPRTFYLQLLNKDKHIHTDLNPTASQEPQIYCLYKLSEIEAYFLNEIEVRERNAKKKMIQYNHRHRRHKLNYINGDH